jgi:GNAT superfamily N-acetyltransferase
MRSRRTAQSQLLHIVAIGLDPRYARAGVATTLLSRNLDLAKRKGFLGAVAVTTGVVSRHILRDKLSFRERFSIDYRSYAYEGVHVFREADGQSGCSWMEKLF